MSNSLGRSVGITRPSISLRPFLGLLLSLLLSLLLAGAFAAPASSQEASSIEGRIPLREWLLLPKVGQGGRMAFPRNPITHALVRGTFEYPEEGDAIPIETSRFRS